MADGAADTQLVTIEKADALAVFTTPEKIDPILARIRQEIDGFTPDISNKRGRDNVASMAYRITRSKTYLDGAGKALVDEMKEVPKKIDATRKRIRDTLDAWSSEVRKPLTEWENDEKARVDRIKSDLSELQALIDDKQPRSSAAIHDRLSELKADGITEERFGEYTGAAAELWSKALAALEVAFSEAMKREAETAELARLRAEAAAREQAERDAKAKAAAEERERRAVEAAAAAERAKAEAAEKALKDAAERREREHKAELEAVERRAVEAAAKAKADAEQAALRTAAEAAKREADIEHRATINRAALAAFVENGIDDATGRKVIQLIASRSIPAISISY